MFDITLDFLIYVPFFFLFREKHDKSFSFRKTKALRELSTDLSRRSDSGEEGYGSNAVMFQIQSDQTQQLTGESGDGDK